MFRTIFRSVLLGSLSVVFVFAFGSAQEPNVKTKDQQATQESAPESLKIEIADEPKTIDPISLVYPPVSRKVSVTFKESSIREVVSWIKTEAGITVLLDEADLADANILLSEPVTDSLADEPLYLLLDRLESISLGWFVKDEILHVTTADVAREQMVTVPHNVGQFFDKGFKPDSLTEAIVNGTDAGEWEDQGGSGTLVLLGDVLFIRQSDRMHRRVSGLLKALEKHGRRTFINDPSEHEALRAKLETAISVEFEDTPLSEAIADLTKKSGADIRIDQNSFRQSRIRAREPVSLKLNNQKLASVLEALVAKLRLTWTLNNGTILVTTAETAEGLLKSAVFDVRDLSRSEDESVALQDAIMMQTTGQWEDDGGTGTVVFAKPGIMIVRQTENTLAAVLKLLETYRQALKISKVRKRDQVDPKEPKTHYYRMPSVIAKDLELWLPILIAPESWEKNGVKKKEAFGSVVRVASRPELMGGNQLMQKQQKNGQSAVGQILLENDVLIIHQSRENHDKIRDLIFKVEVGDVTVGAAGGKGSGGGFGGGFFSLPSERGSMTIRKNQIPEKK